MRRGGRPNFCTAASPGVTPTDCPASFVTGVGHSARVLVVATAVAARRLDRDSGAHPSLPVPARLSVAAMARPSWRSLNPITRTGQFFTRLHENFGWRFILILLSSYVGVRGVAHRLVLSAYLPYMRETAGVTNASLYQAYFTVLNLPWSLKATIGLLSDVLPVGGYHKRYYIIGSVVLGSTACAMLAGAPIANIGGGVTAAVLLFLVSLEVATGA